MMPVAHVNGIESRKPAAAALRQHGVDDAIDEVQAPVLRIRSDKLHRTIPYGAAPEIEPVKRAIAADYVQQVRALVDHRRRGDAVGAEKRSLVLPFPRQH